MPHVSLVDIKRNPIQGITPGGLQTADGVEHAVDVIIFALGFDAFTGAILQLDLKGRDGISIQERWKDGGATYLGMFVDGFPNFAAIYGPQTAFTNIVPTIERQAIFIAETIAETGRREADAFEAQADAVTDWVAGCQQQLDFTLLTTGEARSWFLGTNVEGKPNAPLVYLAGATAYYAELDQVQDAEFRGLVIERAAPRAVVSP
jgi:cyclohexanone monooxygenase